MWGGRLCRPARVLALALLVVGFAVLPACSRKLAPAKPPVGIKSAATEQPAAAAKSEGVQTTSVHPGVYYECEEGMPAPGAPRVTFKWYVSGAKVRIEGPPSPLGRAKMPDEVPLSPGEVTTSILRWDAGVFYALAPHRMMYLEDKLAPREPETATPVQVTATKSSETEQIGPYNCVRYDLAPKGETESFRYWVTSEVDLGVEMSPAWQMARVFPPLAEAVGKLPGFPIRWEMRTPDGMVVTTITTIRKEDIADSLFEVPAGYKKTKIR